LIIPRPIPGLISKRVLVMDYLHGVPLSRLPEEMKRKGIDPHGPLAKAFGRRLLSALTTTFGRSILETGFFHADPHAGNIFVLDDGQVGLIDFGQVKQINGRNRETLCKVMIALQQRDIAVKLNNTTAIQQWNDQVGRYALELGVTLRPDAQPEAAAAVALWLFDGSVQELPGGYDTGELSPNSPVKELASFPQDLVLVGRSTILIKGLSNRLGIPWSLAQEWAPMAQEILDNTYGSNKSSAATSLSSPRDRRRQATTTTPLPSRVRFRHVMITFQRWGYGRLASMVQFIPLPIRRRLATWILPWVERRKRPMSP
jgi:aarF domain-containing kinase